MKLYALTAAWFLAIVAGVAAALVVVWVTHGWALIVLSVASLIYMSYTIARFQVSKRETEVDDDGTADAASNAI